MFNKHRPYQSSTYDQIIDRCTQDPTDLTYNSDQTTPGYNYSVIMGQSYRNENNLCVLNEISQKYPKSNAIYFTASDFTSSNYYQIYENTLSDQGLKVLSSTKAKSWPRYQKHWANPWKYFTPSAKEGHPSKLAHQMFADILFKEITTNLQ